MSLVAPKRLFHVPSMSTVMYVDVADDVKKKGYATISHVWGDRKMHTADELGVKGGVDWKIPLSDPNKIRKLVDAMNHFKMEYCWLDVVCMPQDKQDEINLEIPLMGDYYSGADVTIVLSDAEYGISPDYTTWYNLMSDVMEKSRGFTLAEENWLVTCKRPLLDFKEVWLTRVWTLQEALLSKNIALISKSYFNMSGLIIRVTHLMERNSLLGRTLFGENSGLDILASVARKRHGGMELVHILDVNARRDCYRIHDRFYGVLGILGYKDFVVDYGVEIDELNRKMARYAYSKGDISWMAVGGNAGLGFVQPMYKKFPHMGYLRQRTGNTYNACNVADDVCIKATTFGVVTHSLKLDTDDKPRSGSHAFSVWKNGARSTFQKTKFIIGVFKGWGFGYAEMSHAFSNYIVTSEEFAKVGTTFVESVDKDMNLQETFFASASQVETDKAVMYTTLFADVLDLLGYTYNTAVAIETNIPGLDKFPLMISGNADIGDIILLSEIFDPIPRYFGIVIDKFRKRKGVCMIPEKKPGERDAKPFISHNSEISEYRFQL